MISKVNESQLYEVVTILRSLLAEIKKIVTIQIRLTDIFFYCTRPKCIFCNNNHLLRNKFHSLLNNLLTRDNSDEVVKIF